MIERSSGAMSKSTLLAYALPAFVVALPTIPIYIHLPTLYGIQLGLGLASTGLILLLARMFDGVTDPVIGILCDKYHLRGKRRKPWIALGAIIAGIGLYMVLNPPPSVIGSYLFGWSAVLYVGWTMVSVPYMAWGAELSTDYNERTRITSWRESLALLGIVGAGALAASTAGLGLSEAQSIGVLAWTTIALGVIFIPLMFLFVPEQSLDREEPRQTVGYHQFMLLRTLLRNRLFLRLLSAWFLNGLANGIPAALFFIYLEHGLGAEVQQRPLFILLYFVSAIVAVPLWLLVSRSIGKHRAWCLAMLGACMAFITVPFMPEGALFAFSVVCVITGMALGADLALPPSIQADVIEYDELRSGQEQAGLQFALWSMSTKLALAIAVGLALPGLEMTGFDPSAPTASGILSLTVIYSIVPVVIKLMAIAVVWSFPLTARRQALIRRRLNSRGVRQNNI